MRHLPTAASLLLILILDLPMAAQYPGRYPPGTGYPYPGGGGYPTGPSIPIPRRSKDKKAEDKSNQPQLQTLTGVLRKIDDTSVTIVAQDTRIISAKRADNMKVFKKGEESNIASLTTGARVRIDASQDEKGYYHAVAIYIESEATAETKSAAEASSASSTPKSAGDADEDGKKAETAPQREPAETMAITAGTANELDPDRPRLRRGKPPARKSSASSKTDSNEPPPPETSSTVRPQPQTVALNNSNREADRPEPATPREDPRIAKARQVVGTFTQSLPNYLCQEHIARMASTTQKIDWRPLDVVSAIVVYENGRDEYRNITVNGKPFNKRMEDMDGAWSTGEFGMMTADLFSPATAAEFTSGGSTRIAAHDAVVYDFEVAREHSHWHIQAPSQSIQPAYRGRVWLESKTAEVLRIEMEAYRMPKEFPLDKVESAVDYEYVRLGEHQFLLPVHAETLNCVRGTSDCSRNVIDFRNYRKYTGEATITFDK